MIEIKNLSTEDFTIITHIDERTPGCRILGDSKRATYPEELPAGKSVVLLSYEPGVMLRIVPQVKPEWHREFGVERPWP